MTVTLILRNLVVKFRTMAMRLRYCIYILLFLALSCTKEKEVFVSDGEVTSTIPYRAVVQGSQLTRASIDGPFGTGNYIFQEGDQLFVVDTDGSGSQLYGVLTLSSGANTGNGIFDGTLNCVGDFSPTDDTGLSATLVGPNAQLYSISDDNKITAVNYPDEVPYSANLEDYVKKYSHFTSTSTYHDKHFKLTQQTVFVNCTIKDVTKSESVLSNPAETKVLIKKGDATIRTFTGIPLGPGRYLGDISFFGIFPAGEDVKSGEIWIENDSDPLNHCGDFSENISLQANRYYTLTRKASDWTGFKIKATADANITFNYWDNEIQYSLDNGRSWTAYTSASHPSISLKTGEYVCFKGRRSDYKNIGTDQYETPSNKPIFTANQLCNISGNIMSLLYGDDFVEQTTVPERAFSGAFSKGTNNIDYINIDSLEPLILPAVGLGAKCYMNMFRGCIKLTATPDLPATSVSRDCYRGMFRSCTGLESVSLVLAAPDLAQDCYREMFRDCSKLASVPQGMLPSTNLATSCYRQMFSNCKIPVAPDLPATTLKQECYHTMFSGTPITAAPDLNAATLVKDCYNQMFSGCSQLANVKCLATNISAATCTDAWLKGVKSTGTFTKALSMTSWTTGQNGIPSGWTVENYPAE